MYRLGITRSIAEQPDDAPPPVAVDLGARRRVQPRQTASVASRPSIRTARVNVMWFTPAVSSSTLEAATPMSPPSSRCSPAVWSQSPRKRTGGPNRCIASLTICTGFV